MPSVSVIIPTYNRSGLVKEAIESVLQQTYTDLEVLVVDDGSTDDTHFAVKQIPDNRVKYYYKTNNGQSSAYNFVFKHTTGEYIAYLDSDDIWPPDYLTTMLSELDTKKEYGAAYARVANLYPDGTRKEMTKLEACKSGWITKCFFEAGPVLMPSATCFRRVVCRAVFWDEALERAADYDFFLRCSTRVRFLFVPGTCAIKRWYPENLSSQKDPVSFIEKAHVLERFFFWLNGKEYVPLRSAKRKISRAYRKAAKISYDLGNKDAAIFLIRKAIKFYPADTRLYIGLLKILLRTNTVSNICNWQIPEDLPPHVTVSQESEER